MDSATNQNCTQIAIIVLVLGTLFLLYQSYFYESYADFTSFDSHLPNRNAFGNYYRIGSEQSRSLGWKPHENWDHLRPEFSECPDCFHKDRIY